MRNFAADLTLPPRYVTRAESGAGFVEMAALLTQAEGESVVVERVFDSRFGYAKALRKMGAEIKVEGTRAVIRGPRQLNGAALRAGNDLRSGAAMILAGLVATGDTTLALPIVRDREALRDWCGRDVILGLRPEAIPDPASANQRDGNIHEAELPVDLIEPTGADLYVVTTLGDASVNARMRPGTPLRPGERTRFAFDVSRMVVFDPESERRIRDEQMIDSALEETA